MEPATIMVLRPMKRNDATTFTYQWGQRAVDLIRRLEYKLIDIRKDYTTYDYVSKAIQKYHPRLLISYSHGCPSALNGQNECMITRKFSIDELMTMEPEKVERLINPVKLSGCGKDICQLQNNACQPLCFNETNINLLKDSIIYAVACHSAEILGKCSIKYGVQSYVGYNDLLLFPVDGMKSQDMFGEIHLEFLKNLLEGRSVGEAEYAMRSMEDTYIRLYKKTKWVGLPLLWNHINREVLGDKNARIYSSPVFGVPIVPWI